MIVLTADQHSSRTTPDEVPALISMMSDLRVVAPFERTAGDEVQGVFDHPDTATIAISRLIHEGRWHIGIGVGNGQFPETTSSSHPLSPREGSGDSFVFAREAVEASKRETISLCVRAWDTHTSNNLQALLRIWGVLSQRRTDTQRETIASYTKTGSITETARDLGVSKQAVSQSLKASSWREELNSQPLAIDILGFLNRSGS